MKIINFLIILLIPLITTKAKATYHPPEILPTEFIFNETVFKPTENTVNINREQQIEDLKDYIENNIRIYSKLFIPVDSAEISDIYDIALFEESDDYKVYIFLNKRTKEREYIVNSKISSEDLPVYIYYDQFLETKNLSLLSVNKYNERLDISGKIKEINVESENEYIYQILENKKEFIHKGYFENQLEIDKKTIKFKTGLFIENGVYVLKAYDLKEEPYLFIKEGYWRSDCYFGHSGNKENERFNAYLLTVDLNNPYIYHDKKEGVNLEHLRDLYKKSKTKIPFEIENKLKKVYINHYRYINTKPDNYNPDEEKLFDQNDFDASGFDQYKYNTLSLNLNYSNEVMNDFLKNFYNEVYNIYDYLEPFIKIKEIDYKVKYIDFKNENNSGLIVSLLLEEENHNGIYLRDIVGNQNINFDGINFYFDSNKSTIFYKKYNINELEYRQKIKDYAIFIDSNFNLKFYKKFENKIKEKGLEKFDLINAF